MASLQNIETLLQQRLQKALGELPLVVGNEAVNWVKQNFRRQGYPDRSLTPWKPRKANSRRNAGRGILIGTGRLSRSTRIISTARLQVNIGTDVPYAKAHNEGVDKVVTVKSHSRKKTGNIRISSGRTGEFKTKKGIVGSTIVKAHQRSMHLPKRQFIGNSQILQNILTRKAIVHVGRQLKK